MEGVKIAVMGLNRDSTGGPGGMTGIFYEETWEIIRENIYKMIRAFHGGAELPHYITHMNLVVLPKKVNVSTFSYLRPISLSNFLNKIISRIIHKDLKLCYQRLFHQSKQYLLKEEV